MWEILIFKWFFSVENSKKFQKTRFWKEKSVEDKCTLGPRAWATKKCLPFVLCHFWPRLMASATKTKNNNLTHTPTPTHN
jgi:hypothetical protein